MKDFIAYLVSDTFDIPFIFVVKKCLSSCVVNVTMHAQYLPKFLNSFDISLWNLYSMSLDSASTKSDYIVLGFAFDK